MQEAFSSSFGVPRSASRRALRYLVEAEVENRVLSPVFVIVVPPLGLVDGEALGLHRRAQEVAQAALLGRAARVVYVRALRHLVELAGHRYLAARLQVVERQVYGAAAVVARALR